MDKSMDNEDRQAAIRRGELRHSTSNDQYHAPMFRATYYAWSARRGHTVTGGDPFDGRPAKVRQYDLVARAEGREVHKVQARFWLRQAADIRVRMAPVLP